MTTKVRVQYPTPNHQEIKIIVQSKAADGSWVDGTMTTLSPEFNSQEWYIHGFQRLVIEEFPEVPVKSAEEIDRLLGYEPDHVAAQPSPVLQTVQEPPATIH